MLAPASAVVALAVAIATGSVRPAHAEWELCSAPRRMVLFEAALPRLAAEVRRSTHVRIVALGSSSTAGTGASTPSASYPARLDRELDRRFPGHDFQVMNYGRGGDLASDMLIRIARDVVPLRPALVLWQTGVNDAIRGVPLDVFRRTLSDGITEMRNAGADVVLIDNQFYPGAARVPHYDDYQAVLLEMARSHGIPLFRRYDIMRYLVTSRQYTIDALLAPDRFHLNDLSYGCIADLLAEAIVEAVQAAPPLLARK